MTNPTNFLTRTGYRPVVLSDVVGTINLATQVSGILSPPNGGMGVANNVASTLAITGNYPITFTVSGATSLTLPTSGTVATLSNNLGQFAATTSAQLAGVISDETGSDALVFANSPALTGNPTAPTQAPGDNSTKLATTAYVDATGSGTVTSVTGTTDRISVINNTTTPVVDIAATYVGQTSITTLGTIGTGTWQSSVIGVTYGGTGSNLSATGGTSQVLKQTSAGGNVTVGQLAASDLSNGTTGSGAVVLAGSPTLTGTPLSTTAAADTNTTQIATTSFVVGQASASSPLANAETAVAGTSLRYSRQDHVHPFAVGQQVGYSQSTYTANADLTTIIPYDDTIPQNTEGTEILTVTITPKSATNLLKIVFSGFGATANNNRDIVTALFQDSTASALNASATISSTADDPKPLILEHSMVAGTTSATTFKIRIGPATATTVRLNGTSAARRFGGVSAATLTVQEVQQ